MIFVGKLIVNYLRGLFLVAQTSCFEFCHEQIPSSGSRTPYDFGPIGMNRSSCSSRVLTLCCEQAGEATRVT
jgi:hypothetical protein